MVGGALQQAAEALRELAQRGDRSRSPWSRHDDELIRDYYPIVPTYILALALRRSDRAVYERARSLGVRKSAEFLASPLSGRTGFDDRGSAQRFRPGQSSWNKGRKGWQAGGRARETQFKPGHRPANWKPIGHERINRDGYLERKVRDCAKPSTNNYEPVHKLLWREHHGKIPCGHKVVFRNGDKSDLRIENLELISDADLMRRNTRHRYGEEINRAIAAKAALTRRINKLEKRS